MDIALFLSNSVCFARSLRHAMLLTDSAMVSRRPIAAIRVPYLYDFATERGPMGISHLDSRVSQVSSFHRGTVHLQGTYGNPEIQKIMKLGVQVE